MYTRDKESLWPMIYVARKTIWDGRPFNLRTFKVEKTL